MEWIKLLNLQHRIKINFRNLNLRGILNYLFCKFIKSIEEK